MTMTKNKLYHMVLAGILCAIGIYLSRCLCRVSYLARCRLHAGKPRCRILGMFISPAVAVAVSSAQPLASSLPRRQSLLRAASISCSRSSVQPISSAIRISSTVRLQAPYSTSSLHCCAAAEMIIVTPFFMSGALFTAEQLANGFVASVVLLVGLGTVIHSAAGLLYFHPGLEAAVCTTMPQLRTSQD